ncbi:uncharacterized protein LOC129756390 [Uranotaenia lowii]|uniref:uncharacterized protein LOC129756390 n=1 Tax=Uranotaenia lowii TaxID=190385 RepID=UPI00247AF738|nr:uncharacterized protein LOC129756390 [Uranotaenia lowii]
MWKYVSRRIRDVCDRTQTILEVRRPWPTGERICADNRSSSGSVEENNGPSHGSYCLLNLGQQRLERIRQGQDTGSSSSEKEGPRKQKDYWQCEHSWIGAITWTSAIICGWYTSQLVCLYRRNHKWDGPKCLPYLISAAHRLPGELGRQEFGRCFQFPASPPIEPIPKNEGSKTANEGQQLVTFFGVPIPTAKVSRLAEFDFENFPAVQKQQVVRINNEIDLSGKTEVQQSQQQEPPAPTVESAMENLLNVIGEIEYQLGVQSLETGDYQTAVSHLKLGTSHQHAGAAFNLGICYEQGFGVKKSARVAMECFHLASSLGHAGAMYNLGVYYARGLGGLRRSRSMAKKYFTAAADAGVLEAMAALGPSYNPSKRESLASSADSFASSSISTASSPSAAIPFNFTFDQFEAPVKQYPIMDANLAKRDNRMEPIGLRLVSGMA